MQGDVEILLLAVALASVCASIAYWRQGVVAAMLLLVFEGALRKWALPGAQTAIYLFKDVILLGAYIGFAMSKGFSVPTERARPLILLLTLTAIYGALEVLNPALPSFALAMVGWRAYFFYIPLIFIVPHMFDSEEALYRALKRYALLSVPIAALGILQFFSSMDSEININVQSDTGDNSIIGFGEDERVRVAGSFSFVSTYSAYLMAVALLLGAMLARTDFRLRENAFLFGGLALVIAAMFATGSRGPVYSVIAAAAVYSLFASAAGLMSPGGVVRAFLGIIGLAAAVWYFLPEPAVAFGQRAMGSDDTLERLLTPFTEPFVILSQTHLAGFGIGAAHQSGAYLVGSDYPWWTDGFVAESETSRVMLELGILGFLMVFLFRIWITVYALRAVFRWTSRSGRSLVLVLAIFLGIQIFGAVIFNPTMDLLYWFAVGLLFALERFHERNEGLAGGVETAPDTFTQHGAGGRRRWNA